MRASAFIRVSMYVRVRARDTIRGYLLYKPICTLVGLPDVARGEKAATARAYGRITSPCL